MDLETIKAIAAKRTKGKWGCVIAFVEDCGYSSLCPTTDDKWPATSEDLKFIDMAANNIDALIDELERAQQSEQAHKNMHFSKNARMEKLEDVADAARNAVNNGGWMNDFYIVGLDMEARSKLYKALKALEQHDT